MYNTFLASSAEALRSRSLALRGVRILLWDYPRRFGITDRHSEGIYSNCGFPANMWTINKFDILADIGRPIPRRIESFGTIGKNPGFSYKPVICRKNPGFSPKSRVNPGFALEPEKFLGFRRLGYIYIHVRMNMYTCLIRVMHFVICRQCDEILRYVLQYHYLMVQYCPIMQTGAVIFSMWWKKVYIMHTHLTQPKDDKIKV